MSVDGDNFRNNSRNTGGPRKSYATFFGPFSDIWQLNHCYARIRLISAYCMFLLKRARYYKEEANRTNTVGFVKEQFQEMLTYKGQIIEIEKKVIEDTTSTQEEQLQKIKHLAKKVKEGLDYRFQLVAAKVGEKIPGEAEANALEMTDEEAEPLLESEYENLRQW